MKYSLMSLMVDTELKLMKPNFIHMSILKDMGYEGNDPTIDEVFEFLNAHGVPMKNGTMTFEDLVKLAKDCGYDGLDLMSFHFELPGAEAKEILDKYGIVLSAVNLIIPFANASTEEKYQVMLSRARAAIDQTSEAGCRNMLLMPTVYALDEGITMEQSFHYLTRGLKECVAYGKSRGVVINTETLETAGVSYCTCGEMKRIFDEVEDLKYTHDTGNPIVGLEDPVDMYEMFKDRVAAVHFKEFGYVDADNAKVCRNGRKVDSVPFGTGLIDFKKHLELLKRDNYQGYITLEGSVEEKDKIEGVKESIKYFRQMEAEL